MGATAVIAPDQSLEAQWFDYNGHLNMAFYNVLFDRAVDHMYDLLGIGEAYAREGGGSCFTLQAHVNYLNELSQGDTVSVAVQLVDFDAKRLHYFETMTNTNTGEVAATSENMALHVDMSTRRSAPFPESLLRGISELHAAHAALPVPELCGRGIAIPKRAP
ncbi:MAG: thioesterase family protein [Pseudomonadota bacterium]